ncbi:immunoglobulin omega chain-like [Perognathus longimembris pacificus]|uniref:immunoglobulin omega chain-like n=1 Tax=Perognathus longimembris pacificus TaxID=214514 RepID=UPI0020185F3B|nr:immunoglobulin omega chain-like [Perognathus longimembris pacificus]
MSWTPVLLILLAHCTGGDPPLMLHQLPTASSSLGTTIHLTCALSSDHDISVYSIYWYQQRPGHPPRFLLRYFSHSDKYQGHQTPSRFSGYKDVSSNLAYLSISELQPEDEAMHYCAIGTQSLKKQIVFGSGTQLTVLGQPKASPLVTLFPPSSEELRANKATLACLMNDFYPGTVLVAWKADDILVTEGVETTQPSKQSNNKYMASSYLTLTPDRWRSGSRYTCHVTHEGSTVEKSVSHVECS